jgi:hypothetical protein
MMDYQVNTSEHGGVDPSTVFVDDLSQSQALQHFSKETQAFSSENIHKSLPPWV